METELEYTLTHSYKEGMISYMKTHPEEFDELIKLAISHKPPYSWRAAWLLWSCMEKNDKRVQGNIKKIIDSIKTRDDNHQRELFKILFLMELNGKYESILFDICADTWEQISKRPAVRMNAFKIIVKIAKRHPALYKEIETLTQNQYMDSLSPAVKKAISKMIKE